MKKLIVLVFNLFLIASLSSQENIDTTIVYFDKDFDIPNHNFELQLDSNTTELFIVAYTDTVGTELYNKELAKSRALNVLSKIDTSDLEIKISVSAIGETLTFGDNQKNRCVVIISKSNVIKQKKLNLDFQFISGTAQLNSKSKIELKVHLDSIKGLEFNKIDIHGHVCCSDNHRMSLDRAITVKKQFVNAGIDETLISCFGHSNKYPIVL